METFSLLKFWKGGGGTAHVRTSSSPAAANVGTSATTTTIATSVLRSWMGDDDDDDEGSFFDLQLSVHKDGENPAASDNDSTSDSGDDEDQQGEVNFAVSPSSSSSKPSVSLYPSDDLTSIVITTSSSDSDLKSSQLAVSLLKSATKLRVFMLGLKKPKSPQPAGPAASSPKQNQNHNKFFIKFKVGEIPIVSVFTREGGAGGGSKKGGSANVPKSEEESSAAAAEEKIFSKETVQNYINNKIKPLYIRVSKRYVEKLKFSSELTADVTGRGKATAGEAAAAAAVPAVVATTGKVKLPSGLRVVYKRLGKSKSASSAVVASVASPAVVQQRRDDSLVEQQDGIQSAIAHCKRSLNAASKGSPLTRSKSDPSDDRSEKGNGDRCCV